MFEHSRGFNRPLSYATKRLLKIRGFKMNIQIIGTGSTGNAILLCDSVLVDIGLPFKMISEYSKQIKLVLLSHKHADHVNHTTIRKLHLANESIKFVCGLFLEDELINRGLPKKNILVIDAGSKYKLDDIFFSPFNLYHDTPNFGYRVMHNGEKLIYATDTFSLDGIKAMNYDYGLIEANHDLPTALKIIDQKRLNSEFCHMNRAIKTHLNVDKAIKFIKDNKIKKWIPVHVGISTRKQVFDKIKESNLNQTICTPSDI